jgi:hypothetical protein
VLNVAPQSYLVFNVMSSKELSASVVVQYLKVIQHSTSRNKKNVTNIRYIILSPQYHISAPHKSVACSCLSKGLSSHRYI